MSIIVQYIYVLLIKLGLKTFSVEEIYASFASGELPADGLYRLLKPKQIADFVALHAKVKDVFEDGVGEFPYLLTIHLSKLLIENPRRLAFIIPQVDALIEKDLEKNIFRRNKKKNIVRQE